MTYPNRKRAEIIWEEGIEYRCSLPYSFSFEKEYRFHTQGVAKTAEKIAKYIKNMNAEKAYVLGLLHDYGKRISEKIENKFHGQEGYEQMMKMGYDEVAQICLTHTFLKDFSFANYHYPLEWLLWAKKTLQTVEYTDYDYLISLCDKLFEGMSMVKIEERVEGISKRYNLNESISANLLKECKYLKSYIDNKIGNDVYRIIGL